MKYLLSCLTLLLAYSQIYSQNTFPSTGPAGIGTTSPATPLHIYKNQSGNFLPMLTLEDGLTTGYTQLALKGTGRQYHIGVGNGSEPYFGLANKFYIWDQNAGSGGTYRMVLNSNGHFGFGTNSPSNVVSIYAGSANSSGLHFSRLNNTATPSAGNGKVLSLNSTGHVILVADETGLGSTWGIGGNAGTTPTNDFFGTTDAQDIVIKSNNAERMRISSSGNISIGTDDAKGNKFAVNGDAMFTKIRVRLYSEWPDYVFQPTYQLRSLNDLEKFIQVNKHLPEIPSAEEVEKNGIDVSENQAALLKKIEELTLYLIEQNKQLDQQQQLIAAQQKDILELKKSMQQVNSSK